MNRIEGGLQYKLHFLIEDSVMSKAFTNTKEETENTNNKKCYLKKRNQKNVVNMLRVLDSTPSLKTTTDWTLIQKQQ